MAKFPSGDCSGVAEWRIVGTKWFPVADPLDGATCVPATLFRNGDKKTKVSNKDDVGLDEPDFKALKKKFPEAIGKVDGKPKHFTLPLVPPDTEIDITPE